MIQGLRPVRQRHQPTSQIQKDAPDADHWMLDVGCWMLDVCAERSGCWVLDVSPADTAETSEEAP